MAKRFLYGIALAAGLVVILVGAYRFFYRGSSTTPPEAVPYRTAPEFLPKPAPSVQEPPVPSPGLKSLLPAEPPEPEKQFALLVGRYRTYQEAGKILASLKKEGEPAFIRHEGRQRHPYEVWAGPFPDEIAARAAARLIKKKLKVSAKQEKLQLPVPK
uniref:SPOR domain-containing protein n=1 Tax=Desulfobacca acetoxidans TaxID=60893 RepID=A0A7C3SJE2_9BACT